MSRPSKIIVKESLSELKEKMYSTQHHKVKLKIKSLIIFKEGKYKNQEDIANHLCIGYSTLRLWYRIYSTKGLDDFLKIQPKGKPKSVVPAFVHDALEQKLNDSENSLKGYWDAVNWIRETFGIEINYQTLRGYMIKHFRTKLKVPRKSHYKKDVQAIEAFFKTA